ncbi:UDP-glycosyltransferase [uncultured Olleya sp.]|uniref:UDP-glycosyltransferase n=1 Tax=uncultured Olleya sp. TaxID=757243 RepID=UPI002593F318|nr:UDP-glycosyltransferase [uncultured Olleya sp.]
MKNILIISESIDIDDSSGSKVNVALILNLAALGYDVKVLHYSRKDIKLDGVTCVSIPEIKFSINYLLSRFQRVFQRVTKKNVSKFLERNFGHSFTFFNDAKSISKSIDKHYSNQDLIITLSKGASFRPHYAMLSLPILHSKWMAYVHDPYPFHYYPRPYNWVEFGYQFKEDFFREVSEKANYSAFPSVMLKDWMGSYYFNFNKTGVIIPHQNLSFNKPQEVDIPDYFDIEKFNLLHAGNLMSKRDPRGLVDGFNKFLENNKGAELSAQLLLIGGADYHKEYLNSVIGHQIYWSGKNVEYREVEMLQKMVSVNIILEAKSEISPFLPGKFPNCILANKPILLLGPHYSETKRLLGDDYAYIAEIDDVDLICSQITKLYINWKLDKNASLNRPDLQYYVGLAFLKNTIDNLI